MILFLAGLGEVQVLVMSYEASAGFWCFPFSIVLVIVCVHRRVFKDRWGKGDTCDVLFRKEMGWRVFELLESCVVYLCLF